MWWGQEKAALRGQTELASRRAEGEWKQVLQS